VYLDRPSSRSDGMAISCRWRATCLDSRSPPRCLATLSCSVLADAWVFRYTDFGESRQRWIGQSFGLQCASPFEVAGRRTRR